MPGAPTQDVLALFHPLVREWFCRRFAVPTPAQVQGWPAIAAGCHALVAAPTGSGKTLSAFLVFLDRLVRAALEGRLPGHTEVVYVSPLKALSNDIHKNLLGPLAEIRALAEERGVGLPEIRIGVRTGDTLAAERRKQAKEPPHILITTPESLYVLLTSPSGRAGLEGARTLIVSTRFTPWPATSAAATWRCRWSGWMRSPGRQSCASGCPPRSGRTGRSTAYLHQDRVNGKLRGRRGALFSSDLAAHFGVLPAAVEEALGQLVAGGLVTADGFAALRSLTPRTPEREALQSRWLRHRRFRAPAGGRWARLSSEALPEAEATEERAAQLVRRYGILLREVLVREPLAPPWRKLLPVLRRAEARGEIRGGRFVEGFVGEQFALPEAIERLREVRRQAPVSGPVRLAAADPLNLSGILTRDPRIPALPGNWVVFQDGRFTPGKAGLTDLGKTQAERHRFGTR